MKKIINMIILLAFILLAPQFTQAQGTIYVSNLNQPSVGVFGVGSNSWLAATFLTGTNTGGYLLSSVQLEMVHAYGSPSGFTVTLATGAGTTLSTLNGPSDPSTSGFYTYTPAADTILLPLHLYMLELVAETAYSSPAAPNPIGYLWSSAPAVAYYSSGGWSPGNSLARSSDYGSTWSAFAGYPQYAIDATAIPEPGIISLFALGGLAFLRHRRHH